MPLKKSRRGERIYFDADLQKYLENDGNTP